ncbi:hypothetical protein BC827DRAFT_1145304 [Russula dissimulans]|nr:hypothetical protein BC827DRAFT_1145304 [Russula dissimulans]
MRPAWQAIDLFFNMNTKRLSNFKLMDLDWDLLQGIGPVLLVPHKVQQAMSAESMPMLSNTIVIFELFMSEWEALTKTFLKLSPLINIGLNWAKKYYKFIDVSDVYVVTMVLNPCTHFQWIA